VKQTTTSRKSLHSQLMVLEYSPRHKKGRRLPFLLGWKCDSFSWERHEWSVFSAKQKKKKRKKMRLSRRRGVRDRMSCRPWTGAARPPSPGKTNQVSISFSPFSTAPHPGDMPEEEDAGL